MRFLNLQVPYRKFDFKQEGGKKVGRVRVSCGLGFGVWGLRFTV